MGVALPERRKVLHLPTTFIHMRTTRLSYCLYRLFRSNARDMQAKNNRRCFRFAAAQRQHDSSKVKPNLCRTPHCGRIVGNSSVLYLANT